METIEKAVILTKEQRGQIAGLAERCRLHDGIRLTYPLDEEDGCHYLTWEDGQILSVLAWLPYDEDTAECIAFTRPDRRREGHFSRLLEQAIEEQADCDILFPVSGDCADTMAALDVLGAELEGREYQMEISLGADHPCFQRFAAGAPGGVPGAPGGVPGMSGAHLKLREKTDFRTDPAVVEFYPSKEEGLSVGSLETAPVSEDCVCLHHVEVEETARGQGYGSQMIGLLLGTLESRGIRRVILQVSADNTPALCVYKKAGFRITESLSYYLF